MSPALWIIPWANIVLNCHYICIHGLWVYWHTMYIYVLCYILHSCTVPFQCNAAIWWNISVPLCGKLYQWRFLMTELTTLTITWLRVHATGPTQSHYPDTEPTCPCSILIMLSFWLGCDMYTFLSHWFHSTRFRFVWLLFYVLATSKVISGWVVTLTVFTRGDFIVLLHWDPRLLTPWSAIQFNLIILTLRQPVLALS